MKRERTITKTFGRFSFQRTRRSISKNQPSSRYNPTHVHLHSLAMFPTVYLVTMTTSHKIAFFAYAKERGLVWDEQVRTFGVAQFLTRCAVRPRGSTHVGRHQRKHLVGALKSQVLRRPSQRLLAMSLCGPADWIIQREITRFLPWSVHE